MKKISFLSALLVLSLSTPCAKKTSVSNSDTQIVNNNDVKVDEKDSVVPNNENNMIQYEEDPLVPSDKYHKGFEKRKLSKFYPFKPLIFDELPKLNINTNDGSLDFATTTYGDELQQAKYDGRIHYIDCKVGVSNCDSYVLNDVDAEIKLRGNASANRDKKGFALKFKKKNNLFGLNNGRKFKSWVLNPVRSDSSFLREAISFYIGKQLFNSYNLFSTDYTFTELYLNNQYWGVYLIQEKINVNKNRVNIDDIEDREPIGSYSNADTGYIFEFDHYADAEIQNGETNNFEISYHNGDKLKRLDGQPINPIMAKYSIKSDTYSQEQIDYLAKYVDNIYNILYEAVYCKRYFVINKDNQLEERQDLTSYDVINKVINIDSFIANYLSQEIITNWDFNGSQYFCIDLSSSGDKKMTCSSLWDLDWSFGKRGTPDKGIDFGNSKRFIGAQGTRFMPWYMFLIHEDWFMDLVKEKWQELINNNVLYNSLHYLDEYRINYEAGFNKEKTRWNDYYTNEAAYNAKNVNPLVVKYEQDYQAQQNILFKWISKKYNLMNQFLGDGTQLFSY